MAAMYRALDRFFSVSDSGSTLGREVLAGVTTFLTMAYIVVVQPAVLTTDFAGNPTGMDFGAVLLATCLVAAASTIAMGLVARYPIALAPGMGQNFFFVTVIMSLSALGVPHPWQVALGIVFVAGAIFLLLSVLPVRRMLISAISPSMRSGIAAGIGLFISFIGLRNGGIVVDSPGTLVGLNPDLVSVDVAVTLAGLVTTAALMGRKVKGAIILGIAASAATALAFSRIHFTGVLGWPEIHHHAALALDIPGALTLSLVPFIIVFVFMDLLDTTGTLVAAAEQGGFMKDGDLPRASRAMAVDASSTVGGALMGTSTVTSYIESCAGIAAGGRTGLTSVVTGILFLAALLLGPLISALAGYSPVTASSLIVVGTLMLPGVRRIAWDDASEALPAFLVMVGMPLTYSIADGLAMGFVCYPVVKLLAGRPRQVHPVMWVMAAALLLYFVLVRARMG